MHADGQHIVLDNGGARHGAVACYRHRRSIGGMNGKSLYAVNGRGFDIGDMIDAQIE